jgi:hypothetical protein
MADSEEKHRRRNVAPEMAVAAAVAGLAAANPPAGIAAAGLAPAALAGAKAVVEQIRVKWNARAAAVLAAAARAANIDVHELRARLETEPEREELLLRTLRAAGNTVLNEKLIAYALALAAGGVADDVHDVAWETTFVRALDDLDPASLGLLQRFTWTANRLGLGDGKPGSEIVPSTLNVHQVEMVSADLPNLPALLAVLQRHGLLSSESAGGGLTGGGGTTHWKLTSFGHDFLARLDAIGKMLAVGHDGEPIR